MHRFSAAAAFIIEINLGRVSPKILGVCLPKHYFEMLKIATQWLSCCSWVLFLLRATLNQAWSVISSTIPLHLLKSQTQFYLKVKMNWIVTVHTPFNLWNVLWDNKWLWSFDTILHFSAALLLVLFVCLPLLDPHLGCEKQITQKQQQQQQLTQILTLLI